MPSMVNVKKKIASLIILRIFAVIKHVKFIFAQRSIQDTAGTFGVSMHAEIKNHVNFYIEMLLFTLMKLLKRSMINLQLNLKIWKTGVAAIMMK